MHSPGRLKDILEYHPLSGIVKIRKSQRTLISDQDGLVTVFDRSAKIKSKKYKLEKIAYFLAFGVFPRNDQKVLHKNLNSEDNSLKNLTLVSRLQFNRIKEAYRNLQNSIRLVPHPVDQFDYLVYWIEDGKEKNKVFRDIIEAKKFQVSLQLRFSKILTKFCFFD